MKTLNLTAFWAAVLLFSPITSLDAQLGAKLRNKLKSKKGIELDFSSSPYIPAITMESLMSGGIRLSVDGKLTTKDLSVAFLPAKTKKGERANYDEYKKENLLLQSKVINTQTNKSVGTFHYSVNPVIKAGSPMNQKQIDGFIDYIQLKAGSYKLDFFAAGTLFYSFPFEVISIKNDDPYAPFSEVLFLKGAWENWNYFDFSEYPDHKQFVWHHFMDNTTTNIKNEFRTESNCEYKFKYELFRNGKLFGAHDSRMQGSKDMSYNEPKDYVVGGAQRTKWVRNSINVTRIPGDNPSVWQRLRLSDFKDGSYEMVIHTIDCAGNKMKRSYPFKMSGGQFILHDQQNRKIHKDHITIIEGGPGQFWYKKK